MRVALVVVVMVCAACGEEYVGGSMLQYGGAADDGDYRGHSPDAQLPLDYKYEEELPGETDKPEYAHDEDRWHKLEKIQQRRPTRGQLNQQVEVPESDAVPQLKQSRRRFRHGLRSRWDKLQREVVTPRRRPNDDERDRHVRAREDYDTDVHYLDDYHDHKLGARKETTARVIRRKPRDRIYVPMRPKSVKNSGKVQEFFADETDEKFSEPGKGDAGYRESTSYWGSDERERPESRMRATLSGAYSTVESDGETAEHDKITLKPVTYQDYNDYYNMKLIEHSKTKIPIFLRRTTMKHALLPMWASDAPSTMRPRWRFGAVAGLDRTEAETAPADTDPTTETAPADTDPTTETAPPVTTTAAADTTELSLAEKSRLSILKRSNITRKEKMSGTKKPPVLLLATSRLATVVMVEPSRGGWMRAREVSGDSPRTLDKVKRLMRRKLVAEAADIRDLTDHWNDTVCEYVDMGALGAAPPPPAARAALLCCLAASSLCSRT